MTELMDINHENQQILYSIYNAFENTKSLTQKDILKKCIITSLCSNNYVSKDKLIVQCIDLINILNNNLTILVNSGHFKFNNNKYAINEEHEDFKNFKINNLKILTVTAHSIEYISKVNEMIDDITFGFSISSSDTNEEMAETNDVNNMEENNNLDESYYIYRSLTTKIDWYLISMDLSTCTCKSFQYCLQDIKTCKHLVDFKTPQINLSSAKIVTKEGKQFTNCTCNDFKEIGYCDHLDYLNNKYANIF
jgi:hypothetical protein